MAVVEPVADEQLQGHDAAKQAVRVVSTRARLRSVARPLLGVAGPAQALVAAASARQVAAVSGLSARRRVAVGLAPRKVVALNAGLLPGQEGVIARALPLVLQRLPVPARRPITQTRSRTPAPLKAALPQPQPGVRLQSPRAFPAFRGSTVGPTPHGFDGLEVATAQAPAVEATRLNRAPAGWPAVAATVRPSTATRATVTRPAAQPAPAVVGVRRVAVGFVPQARVSRQVTSCRPAKASAVGRAPPPGLQAAGLGAGSPIADGLRHPALGRRRPRTQLAAS